MGSTVIFNVENIYSQECLLMPTILGIWKLKQEDCCEFQFGLHYIMRLLKNKNRKKENIFGGSQELYFWVLPREK